jgi:hypothetical protein
VGNCAPPKRSANAFAPSGLAKQNTTNSLSSLRREYVSGAADRTPAAQNAISRFTVLHLFGREHRVVRPFTIEVTDGDFTFAAGHRRIAISLVASTMQRRHSIIRSLRLPPQMLTRDDVGLNTVRW